MFSPNQFQRKRLEKEEQIKNIMLKQKEHNLKDKHLNENLIIKNNAIDLNNDIVVFNEKNKYYESKLIGTEIINNFTNNMNNKSSNNNIVEEKLDINNNENSSRKLRKSNSTMMNNDKNILS